MDESSFPGACCPNDEEAGFAFSSAPFVSFSDDLQILQGSVEMVGDDTGQPGKLDLFGDTEPLLSAECNSVCSFTTVATEDLQGKQQSARTPEIAPVEGTGGDAGMVNLDAALNVAFNSSESAPPQQVWETGIWKYIFGDGDSGLDYSVWGQPLQRPSPALWGLDHEVLEQDHGESRKRNRLHACNFMDVVSFKPDIPWTEQRDSDLQRGIKLWVAVTSKWDDRCSFMSRLAEMRSDEETFDMFAHVFSGRAPVTIRKRGMAILKLCDHLEGNQLEAFPMTEITFYRYLCSESAQGAPPSRLQGLLQAVAFCRHVLDVTELQIILNSKRCSGAARETNLKERKQASPLLVSELLKLHSIVEESTDAWDAVFAGAALLCCYCRGRWGDLMRSERAFLDFDEDNNPAYVETRTGRHKTMAAQMHRHQFLPMVAPIKGVNGKDWATPWMDRRRALGLTLPPSGLIMPAPDKSGDATQRPLESGECGKWLRRLLDHGAAGELQDERRISSHSLKCTMLSFAAKRGLSVPDRLMLGYHSSQMHMAMVYSRDGAAASFILLERLIREIAAGKFRPDSTRSGRVVDSPIEQSTAQISEVKIETVLSSEEEVAEEHDMSDSSGSTSSSESASSEILEGHSLNKVFTPPQPPEGYSKWQHSKLKTVHLTEPGYSRVFVCGRTVGTFHHRLEQDPRFDSPICWACFRKAS